MAFPVSAGFDQSSAGGAEDAGVVSRVRVGDARAFDAVVAEHFPVMVRYASTLVPSREDAEDVAQSVLARVWRLRESWNVTTTIRTYLLSAVRNEAANRRRTVDADAKRQAVLLHEVHVRAAVWERGEGSADALADREQVAALLATLTPRRREAVVLRYGVGLSYAEIGQVMGLSRKAAEQVVLRALGTLRQQVAEGR
jgi:RNA polymerase sigma-70 factor (ECF subfamily)